MAPGGREMGRAERFEDEKRRIIDSCFNRRDDDGSVIETYITHIKILEFSSHPISPPPPASRTPQSEKNRIIIVAVRKSGRVRVHKSKENANGSFSIGKTWDLNDLTAIESYTAANVNPDFRAWAGNVGFLITLGKPYYWQAQTDKEKRFFIASLLKIYGKYSGGRVPTLVGFDSFELDQIQGGAQRRGPLPQAAPSATQAPPAQAQTQAPPPPTQQLPPQKAPPSTISAQSSFSQLSQPQQPQPTIPVLPPVTREPAPNPSLAGHSGYGARVAAGAAAGAGAGAGAGPDSASAGGTGSAPGSMGSADFRNQRSAMLANGTASPAASIDSSRSAMQTAMRRLAGNKSQESFAASVAASMTGRSDDGSSLPPRSRNGPPPGSNGGLADSPAITEGKPPPERKRPPMDPSRPQGISDDNLVPAPLMSMGRSPATTPTSGGNNNNNNNNNVMPPPRSSNRSSPFNDTSRSNDMVPSPLRSPSNGSYTSTSTAPPTQALPRLPPQSRSISDFAKVVSAASAVSAATPASGAPAATSTPTTESPTAMTPTTTPGDDAAAGAESPSVSEDPDDSRPGLGPMIKNKSKGDIANAFWKAATAASVFKPRPGGAGDRLRQAANKSTEGPDGITGVVPAPPRPVSPKPEPEPAASDERPKTPQRTSVRSIPEVKITVPNSSRPSSLQKPQPISKDVVDEKPPPVPPKPKPGVMIDTPRKSVISGNDTKYLAALGVDSTIMDKHSVEFAKWLDYFGWVPGDSMRKINTEDLKIDLDRELNRAQAGGWLARFQEEDDRVESIKKGIDTAIGECEELDNLLTLYSVELSTLSDDIAYIEAQGQGLQVQAANQKLLKKELESLLDTCAITSNDLEALRTAPLETPAGIEEIETALVTLYKAMSKINPSLGTGGNSDGAASALAQLEAAANGTAAADQTTTLSTDFGQMRVVREKKEMYLAESDTFMRRLVICMATEFDQAWALTRKAMESALAKKVDPRNHDVGRDMLWKYSPLILYAREADLPNWNRIIQIYEDKSHPVYKVQFRDLLMAWKKNARKPNVDDSDILFTSLQEKKDESITTTARKLTVKRSQTLARTLRSPLGDGKHSDKAGNAGNDSRSHPYEVFASVLEELLPLVQMEQNFIIDLFHATTLHQTDFADAVAACRPADRRGTSDLRRHRPMEPDRELARRVTRAMEAIFSFLEQDLQALIEWVLSLEALEGIGVMATLERRMGDLAQSNQEFLNTTLHKLHSTLEGRFRKFVDEQVRAIEDTKVKIKKRKGVIGFMRIFPIFSAAVESMLADVAVDDAQNPSSQQAMQTSSSVFGVRRTVDGEYDRILRSMFESLKVIARENPTMTAASAGSADPEDKEALNFHILLIENMNHYIEEVDNARGIRVLAAWKEEASAELREHMSLYLNAVMRRPLGRLLEHLENVEAQLASGKAPAAVAAQPSNSKNTFNKVLGSYDSKEVRKGIDTLRKRVEKHFSGSNEEDDDAKGDNKKLIPLPPMPMSQSPPTKSHLVAMVLAEAERFYGEVEMRINTIVTNVYGGDVMYEWPRADVKQAFAGR